ncbi:hypothetical protein PoB_005869000 [Plakobranchus ocellatus]|uniref:Uncharacterized protein n=1 Tax=Plakobranchus ocellatus TaxID=259542 RepID=A0AAV4CH45_9GAST|nr:hypothetical protein PoB_005869000 [Plakobranchus ocellatus]
MHTCSGVYDPRHLHGKDQGTGAEETSVMCSRTLSELVDRKMNYTCRLLCQFTALDKNVLHVLSNRRIIPPFHLIGEVCMQNSLVHLRTSKIKTRQHIKSFPTITSHYSRQMNPNKRYLHPNLNIK